MTLHEPDQRHDVVVPPPQRARRRSWKPVVVAAALAVALLAIGVAIGRATTSEPGRAEPFDVDAFSAAQGSGDADQIRAFYTDDAVAMPFGHILSSLSDHPMPEYWDVSGIDMDREAAEHRGGTFVITHARQVGNMVVTTGRWTFPEGLFPDSGQTVIDTTSIMHLRDGKIWRHFMDFEVYVDGTLIEM